MSNFSLTKEDKFAIIKFNEERLLSVHASELKSIILSLYEEEVRNIILDMVEIKFMDSSGLSAVLYGNKTCKRSGGVLVMARYHENILNLLKIAQLDNFLMHFATLEEAKDFIMFNELERDIRMD